MRKWIEFLFFIMIFGMMISCQSNGDSSNEKYVNYHTGNWKSDIGKIMAAQETAWNSGNLKEFMQPYWQSDSLVFIGSRGLNYGWKTTLENYQKSYPDKQAMGTLLFENQRFESLGENHAFVIGRWNLFRESDTLDGSYSLIWRKLEGEWKIVADHSS